MVRSVLISFQYIEEQLRAYLSLCYDVIRNKLQGSIPFKYTYSDNERDSLGALISKYEKFSDDSRLINELKELVQHRNGLAHRGFMLKEDQRWDAEELKRMTSALEKVKERASNCFGKLST